MVFMAGGLYVWLEGSWEASRRSESNLDAFTELARKVARVDDNVDLNQNTVASGRYLRAAKPGTPIGPAENTVAFLQDGGEEATTFAEIQNIQINKTGQGPYADFSDAKVGDVLLIQSQVDGSFGQYVIRNKTEQPTYWDFGLAMYSGRAEGPCTLPLTRPSRSRVPDLFLLLLRTRP